MARRWKGAKLKRQSCPTRGGGRGLLTVSTAVHIGLKPLRRTTTEVRPAQVPAYLVCKFILMRRNNKAAEIFLMSTAPPQGIFPITSFAFRCLWREIPAGGTAQHGGLWICLFWPPQVRQTAGKTHSSGTVHTRTLRWRVLSDLVFVFMTNRWLLNTFSSQTLSAYRWWVTHFHAAVGSRINTDGARSIFVIIGN